MKKRQLRPVWQYVIISLKALFGLALVYVVLVLILLIGG